jgi:hypothetical protein
MRILAFFTLAVLLILTIDSTVHACDCLTLDPQKSFKEADVVFEGELDRLNQSGHQLALTFKVSKGLKGDLQPEVTLLQQMTNCDPSFVTNVIYRVYARRLEDRLLSSSCFANEVLAVKRMNPPPVRWQNTFSSMLLRPKALVIVGICLPALVIIWFLGRGLQWPRS